MTEALKIKPLNAGVQPSAYTSFTTSLITVGGRSAEDSLQFSFKSQQVKIYQHRDKIHAYLKKKIRNVEIHKLLCIGLEEYLKCVSINDTNYFVFLTVGNLL